MELQRADVRAEEWNFGDEPGAGVFDVSRKSVDEALEVEACGANAAVRYMVSPPAKMGKPPLPAFVLQLEEARAEWRRRHRGPGLDRQFILHRSETASAIAATAAGLFPGTADNFAMQNLDQRGDSAGHLNQACKDTAMWVLLFRSIGAL